MFFLPPCCIIFAPNLNLPLAVTKNLGPNLTTDFTQTQDYPHSIISYCDKFQMAFPQTGSVQYISTAKTIDPYHARIPEIQIHLVS